MYTFTFSACLSGLFSLGLHDGVLTKLLSSFKTILGQINHTCRRINLYYTVTNDDVCTECLFAASSVCTTSTLYFVTISQRGARIVWSFWWCWTVPTNSSPPTPPTRLYCVSTFVSSSTSITRQPAGATNSSTHCHFDRWIKAPTAMTHNFSKPSRKLPLEINPTNLAIFFCELELWTVCWPLNLTW